MTGSTEPIYGPEAYRSIDSTVKDKNPYGKLTISDLTWKAPHSSNVETQTFYFMTEDNYYGFFQVIHSNPIGLHFTAQFTCLVVNDDKDLKVWTSTNLENFVAKDTEFNADGISISLNEQGTEYIISSVVSEDTLVEITVTRDTEGFKIGENGTSLYGENLEHPWGSMRHVFWPKATGSGKLVVKGEEIMISKARIMFVMAMQGMKPHHAAKSWNFLNFQGPTMSAVVMEYVTPPSYGEQRSSIGGFVKDNKLISTAVDVKIEHIDCEVDEVGWSAPKAIKFELDGPKIETPDDEIADEKERVLVSVEGDLKRLVDRVDVMAEIPSFIKSIAAGVSGAKPYIYQYYNKMKLTAVINGETIEEEGISFSEATFIS